MTKVLPHDKLVRRRPSAHNKRDWSTRNAQILRSLWPDVDAISERLDRTRKAVRQKAHKLGLPRIREQAKTWTIEDKARALAAPCQIKWVAAGLGRTVSAIKMQRYKHRHTAVDKRTEAR